MFKIKEFKKEQYDDALKKSVKIFDNNNVEIGKLVPIGEWVLKDNYVVNEIYRWRKRAMRFFLTQFKSSIDSTLNYLKKNSVDDQTRLLFLIYDIEKNLIGHIGIANVKNNCGELDNMMRGNHGGSKDLIYFAEISILKWCFNYLNLKEIYLRVLSFNKVTINIHLKSGFNFLNKIYLYKKEEKNLIEHLEVNEKNSNVKYFLQKMNLSKKSFLINEKK